MIDDIISPEFSEFLKLLFTWFEIIAVILYEYKAIKNLRKEKLPVSKKIYNILLPPLCAFGVIYCIRSVPSRAISNILLISAGAMYYTPLLLMQLVKEISLLPICIIALIVIIMKGL